MSDTEPELQVACEDGVLTLTLNRPARRNALTRELIAALTDAVANAAGDASARVIVVCGAGNSFCSGVDLDAAATSDGPPFPQILTALTRAIRTSDRPVIAAVEGPAYGAGLALALAADIRVVAEGARLCEAYIRIGRFAGGGDTYWLPQLVGTGSALRMLWTGEVVTGHDAVPRGLADECVPDGQAWAVAADLARTIATAPPPVIARTKHAVYGMRNMPIDDALARSVLLSAQGDLDD
jgi:2-(1,2-epoxy-1,2-dihydrophenyl)acetyl-CoA isomerase